MSSDVPVIAVQEAIKPLAYYFSADMLNFFPYFEDRFSFRQQAHLLMRKLHQRLVDIKLMPREERLFYFEMEYRASKEENTVDGFD